ncbi:methyltransferase domain-containing protein [Gallaecimonas pentaromativorans]|uniref:methyltransferase domain-containing protein n=1 Tax=Gallaecimonas pentaromativorans TaxID=584787 RepID=UPI003A8EAFE9
MALADVARAFGSAARQYDSRARLQQQVADWLLEAAPARVNTAVDLGCGTGYCLARLNADKRFGLDISRAMLLEARQKAPDSLFIQADAQQLPLATGSVDLLVSSLALQWCGDLSLALGEVGRVLAPGGQALLTVPLAGSLNELASAWGASQGHLLAMPDENNLAAMLPTGARLKVKDFVVHFDDLTALRQSLKGVGAHHVPGRAQGLTGKARYRQFVAAIEAKRTPLGLPLTYRIGLISWQNAFL